MPLPTNNYIGNLAAKLGKQWPAIEAASSAASRRLEDISNILADHRLIPSDASLVVFGSLARKEWTVGSDVDWTLLIDGQADPNHLKVAHDIRSRFVLAKLDSPGVTGTFGGLAFSHDLINQIGGEEDTNKNTTRRILLLLESVAIGNPDAYDRVIKAVLNRYLDDDLSFLLRSGEQYKVPRFLLNDIVRYWRTMCVDYATKHRERQGEKWALRNVKLRLSRKLIFAAGLLTCFNCHLRPPVGIDTLFEQPGHLEPFVSNLRAHVRLTPLEILADAADSFAKPATCLKIFDAYDQFLSMMNDGAVRERLGKLKAPEYRSDADFEKLRQISGQFQDGLNGLFLDDNTKLSELTRKYGIF